MQSIEAGTETMVRLQQRVGRNRRRKRPLVVVAEDHLMMQQVLVDVLAWKNIQSLATDHGDIALALVDVYQPDLVLLDVNLPGAMNGIEVLEAIRENPRLASTRVILLTVDENVLHTTAAEVADEVLLKPINPDRLLSTVVDLLKAPVRSA